MTAIEAEFEPLQGVLPKDYGIFEPKVLEDLMRLFNSEQIKQATGDVFGRIYEYFLAKFSIQKAHDNGEFFTPSSLVQTIVNVIEPDHGIVFDPACGSGGMFVQSSHFIEHEGGDTAKKVVFYGQEKNRDTIRIAKMNLAVHGLEGKIAEAITYYQDEHNLVGKCDFVMANPPFNVDLVDAERIKDDPRLPFGLPGVNKQKKVVNGNYLWISYFWSYLNEKGRAGFVMSSQASSAGHGEKEVRQKIVETGDVDVMISIRSNFFYTRTVPCELWFFDRAKPAERQRQGADARRAQRLPQGHAQDLRLLARADAEPRRHRLALPRPARAFPRAGEGLPRPRLRGERAPSRQRSRPSRRRSPTCADASTRSSRPWRSMTDSMPTRSRRLPMPRPNCARRPALRGRSRRSCSRASHAFGKKYAKALPGKNDAQHAARKAFDPDRRGDPRAHQAGGPALQARRARRGPRRRAAAGRKTDGDRQDVYDRRAHGRLVKQLDEERKAAVEQLKHAAYFHRQVAWLQDRFPKADCRPCRDW